MMGDAADRATRLAYKKLTRKLGKHPSKLDVVAFTQSLGDWTSVDDCERLVANFQRDHGSYARGSGIAKPWRECFHAVRFARAVNAEDIKIGADPPDFEFRVAGHCLQVELVVARDVDDMTSKQFLQAANFIGPKKTDAELVGENVLSERWESLPNRIAKQVEAKSGKGYPNSFVLAVAASSWWWADEQEWMESAIRKFCRPYFQSFAGIWVLAGSHFISLMDANHAG